MGNWSIGDARNLYNMPRWGEGYVDIASDGHLQVRPTCEAGSAIDLYELARELQRRGLSLPVLIRFNDILHDRVDALCGAFELEIQEQAYQGRFTGVYPIKVNQQRSVVREILAHGGERVGLEAGSKPELLAVMGLSDAQRGSVVVCNGYKDREYLRLALIGQRLGLDVHIVVEKLSELDLIIEESTRLEIEPQLGMRIRLASMGAGKWQNTGGEKSKFGLSAAQVSAAVERLHRQGMLQCLSLLHCHMGSQIANIRDIQGGMREAARYYAELRGLGAPIRVVDVGGGLGVDYEGAGSRSFCSINYSIREYARNVVRALEEVCAETDLPHPDIYTESGRALTAHHAVLVTDVIDHEPAPIEARPAEPHDNAPVILRNLWDVYQNVKTRPPVESYHDAAYWRTEAQAMFSHGHFGLDQRAQAEQLYFAVCGRIRPRLRSGSRSHRALLDELNDKLADKYFCNFSLFQSLPDVWAIDQIFPIVPLHRLDAIPNRRAILQDLTCDSDGCILQYVDSEGVESTLPLHSMRPDEQYLIGFFLVGAYQEILGDMHNLFGDTHSVNVSLAPGGYKIHEPVMGESVSSMLRYVNFEPEELVQSFRAKISAADLQPERRRAFLAELEAGLSGYTYLEE